MLLRKLVEVNNSNLTLQQLQQNLVISGRIKNLAWANYWNHSSAKSKIWFVNRLQRNINYNKVLSISPVVSNNWLVNLRHQRIMWLQLLLKTRLRELDKLRLQVWNKAIIRSRRATLKLIVIQASLRSISCQVADHDENGK